MKIKVKKNPAPLATKEDRAAAAVEFLQSDMEAQHCYVEGLKKSGEKSFQLVAASAFVEGMRDSGYKSTATAIDELVDNAIQAQAKRVDVLYDVSNPQGNQHDLGSIAVVDNGHGMEPEMIRAAVLWGGTHRQNDRSGFGRFGFGLPSASVSITRHFDVYSRINGGDWYRVSIDLDEICSGKLTNDDGLVIAPRAEKTELPNWVVNGLGKKGLNQGTVVVLYDPDRLSSGYKKPNGFHRSIMEHLGLIYRGVLSRCAIFVNGQAVQPVDPLFLDPDARYYDMGNRILAQGREPMQFTMRAPSGREGAVRLRFSYMPPKFQRNADGKENERMSIMKANNAYLIVTRAGRQIDLVKNTNYKDDRLNTTIVNYDANWGVELDFDPELDEEFGITVNKQQVTLTERVWEVLADHNLPAIIRNDLRKAGKEARADDERKGAPDGDKTSEKVMAEADKFVKKKTPISDEKKEEARKKVEAEAEKEAEETQKPKEEVMKEKLAEAEAKKYVIEFEEKEGAPFFRPELFGPQVRIWINTRHRFYTDVYSTLLKHMPRACSSLELLLFAVGAEEATADGESYIFYKNERKSWSDRYEVLLQLLDRRTSLEDEQSAMHEETENALHGLGPGSVGKSSAVAG